MHLKLHSHMAKPDNATSMAPAARDAPIWPYQEQRKPSPATPTAPHLPRTGTPGSLGFGREGGGCDHGEGNMKKMGRSSCGTDLGDMGTSARRPSGLKELTGLVSKRQGVVNREPGESTCI